VSEGENISEKKKSEKGKKKKKSVLTSLSWASRIGFMHGDAGQGGKDHAVKSKETNATFVSGKIQTVIDWGGGKVEPKKREPQLSPRCGGGRLN